MARDYPGVNGNSFQALAHPTNDISGTAFTACCWIRTSGVIPDGAAVFNQYGASLKWDWYHQSSRLEARISDGAGNDTVTASTNLNASVGIWKFLALRKNGTGADAFQIFVNSQVDGTAISNRSIHSISAPVTFGQRPANDSPWAGPMAEFAMWDRALTNPEIQQINNGQSPLDIHLGNLKGYWPFCGTQSPEPDLAQGNQALLSGTVPFAEHIAVDTSCVILGVPVHAGWPGRG